MISRILSLFFAALLSALSVAFPVHADIGDAQSADVAWAEKIEAIAPQIDFAQENKAAQPPPAWLEARLNEPGYVTGPGCAPHSTWIGGGAYVDRACLPMLGFWDDLQTTLVPQYSRGSGTPTFTRATTATHTDFESKLTQVLSGEARFQGARRVRNLIVATEALSGGSWSLNGTATITAGATDPLGGTTAFTLNTPAAFDDIRQVFSSAVSAASVIRGSVWLKADSDCTFSMVESTGGRFSTQFNVTTSWQRFATGVGAISAAGATLLLRRGAGDTATKVYIWRPQVEDVTGQTNQNPSEYVSVGVLSAPYHGAGVDGVKYFNTLNGNTVASNIVTEATGAAIVAGASGVAATAPVDSKGPFGYLSEGARTNRALHSQDFSNAVWVSGGGGVAVATNSIAAPDGTTTADTLTASGANGTLIQDLGVVASASKNGGLWLKRKTGTGNIDLTMDGGATWTTVAVDSTWTRFSKNQTLADEDFGVRIVTSGDAVYAWQGQVETAGFLSSDIPTTTAAVTRNADVLTYPTSGNVSDTVGTMYAEWWESAETGNAGLVTAGATARGLYRQNGKYSIYDGTTVVLTANTYYAQGNPQKQAVFWGNGTMGVTGNGGALATGAFDGNMSFGSSFSIDGNSLLFGTIRNVRIWLGAMSQSQVGAIATNDDYIRYVYAEGRTIDLSDSRYLTAANDDFYRKAANQ